MPPPRPSSTLPKLCPFELGDRKGGVFTGCGKTLPGCHSERSEESRQFVRPSNSRDPSSPAAPQDDSFEGFFRSLFNPAAKPLTHPPRRVPPLPLAGEGRRGEGRVGNGGPAPRDRPSPFLARNPGQGIANRPAPMSLLRLTPVNPCRRRVQEEEPPSRRPARPLTRPSA